LEVPTIYKAYVAYVREYPHKIWPYMVQYLHFRILEFPLTQVVTILPGILTRYSSKQPDQPSASEAACFASLAAPGRWDQAKQRTIKINKATNQRHQHPSASHFENLKRFRMIPDSERHSATFLGDLDLFNPVCLQKASISHCLSLGTVFRMSLLQSVWHLGETYGSVWMAKRNFYIFLYHLVSGHVSFQNFQTQIRHRWLMMVDVSVISHELAISHESLTNQGITWEVSVETLELPRSWREAPG
jgi:hypothetical protein